MNNKTALPLLVALTSWAWTSPALGEESAMYLQDRGAGIATSMFGAYVRPGELLVYPFYEYYDDNDAEYKPAELGYGLDRDFRGKYRAHEFLLFLGYGVSNRLALEFEVALIDATQYKSGDDTSSMPDKLHQSGLGDVEGQIRWRWTTEDATRPELFGYFETVFPAQRDKKLIGTSDYEFKLGLGAIKGFGWGTVTARAAMAHARDEGKTELGEYALEYLKRVSKQWRVLAAVEGDQDEVGLILEAQYFLTPRVFAKLNGGFGLTSKAADFAPEIGVMFSF